MPPTAAVRKLIVERAVLKRKVTSAKNLCTDDATDDMRKSTHANISDYFSQIKEIDVKINEQLVVENAEGEGEEEEDGEELSESLVKELAKQEEYIFDISSYLMSLTVKNSEIPKPNANASSDSSSYKLHLPQIACDTFSGESSSNVEYFDFSSKFKNIIGNRSNLTPATKLTYLKSFLKGYALKIVQNLQIIDSNYDVALELLDKEFLNKPALIDELLKKFLNLKPKYDPAYLETKTYLNEVRCLLADMKVFGIDFLGDNANCTLISHIVFNCLPVPFKQELVRKVEEDFPSIHLIFEHYPNIIRTLNLRNSRCEDKSSEKPKPKGKVFTNAALGDRASKNPPQNSKTVQNSSPPQNTSFNKTCKFCSSTGSHTMMHCRRFPTVQARIQRCKELKLCLNCTSTRHTQEQCRPLDFKCIFCESSLHISALCEKYVPKPVPNAHSCFCLNSSNMGKNFVLPTVNILVGHGKVNTQVRCLIDTGSQRSYLSHRVVERLDVSDCSKRTMMVSTFLNSGYKELAESAFHLDFQDRINKFQLPLLIDQEFKLNLSIDGLCLALNNISKKHQLADQIESDTVELEGLLGIDAIQYLSNTEIVPCLGGMAFQLPNGVIPFGNVDNFLSNEQLNLKYADNPNEDNSVAVNFVLNPIKSNFDPISSVMKNSNVEDKLDRLFNMEHIGVSDDSKYDNSDYDNQKLSEFQENIQLIDGKYHVPILWHDNIHDVQSNFNICKSVLDKLVPNLKQKGLYDSYNEVFEQQLRDGIIKPINLNEIKNVHDKIWIPHRAVVKTEEHVTTKVRPVLNCSLKIRDTPSLNESAYPGVDLLNDLFKLLIKIRGQDLFVMSDIRQAFLQIKLLKDVDKDRFSILWFNKDNQYVGYRYSSIVFGFVASPFILCSVIKHHLSKYPNDECNRVLNDNLYMDNLYYTGNNEKDLEALYNETFHRMKEGGFDLRSWVSNSPQLRDLFKNNNHAPSHQQETESVLGYCYHSVTDQISLSPPEINADSDCSKRKVLSFIAQTFDPLGLVLPLLVRGKLFLRKLWEAKFEWDEVLDEGLTREWAKIRSDIAECSKFKFPRKSYNNKVQLIFFCDASKQIYGFGCYARYLEGEDYQCDLIFSKAKTAPIKSKSIPCLELLAAFLAFKCLNSIIDSLPHENIESITYCIDSQVVLSWIISKKVKSKNIFASNRVKDIAQYRAEILERHGIDVKFKYVPTDYNIADVISRGLSHREFQARFDEWAHGPSFLRSATIDWPVTNLGSMSKEAAIATSLALTPPVAPSTQEDLLDLDKYSSLNKVLNILTLVYRFLSKIGKWELSKHQCYLKSKTYLIRHEQLKYLSNEIKFLKNPISNNVPNLVNNLNLFTNDQDLVCSQGRLGNCARFDDSVKNPIILPKESKLTRLYISHFHNSIRHLGVGSTLQCIRNGGFWIPRGRQIVNSVVKSCIPCKRFNSYPFKYPKTNDLISDKVNFIRPYQYTGVDYTGHVFVKTGDKLTKMYILVFTCMNIRSIHLELLPSLTCKDFLLAFTRFSNAQGMPEKIFSDNMSTFIQALGILSKSHVTSDYENFLRQNNVEHVTIPLYSAWVGSSWERMIKTIKRSITKVLGRKHVDYFTLITLLSDIQNSVNNRPLTYRDSSDPDFQVLSPNSFLKISAGRSLVLENVAGSEVPAPNRKDLVSALETREGLFEDFKERFYEDYLLNLRENSRDLFQKEWQDVIKEGDVVTIFSPSKARKYWQLGIVSELLPGKDGKVRTVKVTRPDKTEGVYSIKLLYPLELETVQSPKTKNSRDEPSGTTRRRSPRLSSNRVS